MELSFVLPSAVAVIVDATAFVAELSATTADHVAAAFRLFDPELASVALLEALTLRELYELAVVLVNFRLHLVLMASHAIMIDALAAKTIVLVALRTNELIDPLIIDERKLAVRRGAPRHIWLMLKEVLQLELLVFVVSLIFKQVSDVALVDQCAALRVWTLDWKLAVLD